MQINKDLSDKLRTILWYEWICAYFNMVGASPHLIEVEVNKRLLGRYVTPKGRWNKYRDGSSVPRRDFVLQIERIVPNSSHILFHPLWPSLRADLNALGQAEKLLQALPAKIRHLVFIRENDSRKKLTLGLLNSLKKCLGKTGELDVLACLVIFLREAHAHGNPEIVDLVGWHIHGVLLVLLGAGAFHPIAEPLFEIFRTRILSLTGRGNKIIIHRPDIFLDAVGVLRNVLSAHEESNGAKFSTEEKIELLQRLIYRDKLEHGPQSMFWQLKTDRHPSLQTSAA